MSDRKQRRAGNLTFLKENELITFRAFHKIKKPEDLEGEAAHKRKVTQFKRGSSKVFRGGCG